ncbi:MAG: glycosyltransferase family 87 protein [bacterium]
MKLNKTRSSIWVAAMIAVIAIVFIWLTAYSTRKAARGDVSDFQAYYVAAQALCNHTDPYFFSEKPYIYPPLFATLCMPLTSFSIETAATLYLPLLVAAVLLSLFWGAREIMDRFNLRAEGILIGSVALITLLIMEDRIKSDLQMFQVNSLLMALLTLSLRWLDRRPVCSGAALGLAMNIKVFPLIMLPYLLFRRRWVAAGAMVASTAVFGLLPALALGWKTNLQYLAQSSGGFLSLLGVQTHVGGQKAQIKDVTASYSVSITSGMARIAGPDHALLAWVVVVIALVGSFAFGIWAYRRAGRMGFRWPDRIEQQTQPWRAIIAMEWATLIAIALIFSPQTNSRHLLMVTTLATLAAVMLLKSYRKPGWGLVLAGTALLWAALTLPPGNHNVRLLHDAHVVWQFIGGPSWVLLAALGPLVWGGFVVIRNMTRPETEQPHQ